MSEVIFSTVHGSRLYGFDHEASDYDTFVVTDSRASKAVHRIKDGKDRVTIGIWHFLDLAMSGSHQSVEALFSPVKEWADTGAARQFRPIIEATRVSGSAVSEKYERTIRKFCYGDFKRRRHAVRLASQLEDIRALGYVRQITFSPLHTGLMSVLAIEKRDDDLARILNVFREGDSLSDEG